MHIALHRIATHRHRIASPVHRISLVNATKKNNNVVFFFWTGERGVCAPRNPRYRKSAILFISARSFATTSDTSTEAL